MRVRLLFVIVAIVLLGGCASHSREKLLDRTLSAYGEAIRWGDIASGIKFIDPEILKNNPPGELQLARYQQVRVSRYDTDGPVPVRENEVHQLVRIGLINRHTMRQRTVLDRQVWRYDPETDHWWLESGLPRIVPED